MSSNKKKHSRIDETLSQLPPEKRDTLVKRYYKDSLLDTSKASENFGSPSKAVLDEDDKFALTMTPVRDHSHVEKVVTRQRMTTQAKVETHSIAVGGEQKVIEGKMEE